MLTYLFCTACNISFEEDLPPDNPNDDVLIMADPYDITDHYQDGYTVVSLSRLFNMWTEGSRLGKKDPYKQSYVVIYKQREGNKIKKNNVFVYVCIAIFGILGIYLTFFAGNTSKYDSKVEAYRISPNESSDSDGNSVYYPTYYFKVDGKEYECKTSRGSSKYPNKKNNLVYYDSTNPEKCETEYEKSASRLAGIICLIATAIIVYFFVIYKPSNTEEVNREVKEIDPEVQRQIEEKAGKAIEIAGKIQLIYKRVVIGIIIAILLFFILIDTAIVKQTIESRDYIDTTATFVEKKETSDSNNFDDCVYTFKDKEGNDQVIIVSVSKDEEPESIIKIKYNEKNPQDYYGEHSVMDKTGIIQYVVKIVAVILLLILFFNKKLLSKVNVSSGRD